MMGPCVRSLLASFARRVSRSGARNPGTRAEAHVPASKGLLSWAPLRGSAEEPRTQPQDAGSWGKGPLRCENARSTGCEDDGPSSKARAVAGVYPGRALGGGGQPQACLPSASAALRVTHAVEALVIPCARIDLTPMPGALGARRWLTGTPGLQQGKLRHPAPCRSHRSCTLPLEQANPQSEPVLFSALHGPVVHCRAWH